MYINGMKNPAKHRNPLIARIRNAGLDNNDKSNMSFNDEKQLDDNDIDEIVSGTNVMSLKSNFCIIYPF